MLQITDTARGKIHEILDQNTGKYIRLFIEGMGWGGPQIGMALDEPKGNEKPVQVNGIGLLVDEFVSPYVEETTVDYLEDQDGKGFIITNGEACSR